MSGKVSNEVSSIRTLNEQQVNKHAPEGEEVNSLMREDEETMTSVGDIQYDVNLPTKVTVQHQTTLGEVKAGAPACRDRVTGSTRKGDKEHQSSIGEFQILRRDDNNHVTSYRGYVKTLNG